MALRSFDAVVVGAGIVGVACARELSNVGMKVVICERSDVIGGGATAAGMGHLAVMDDSEAQFNLTSYSQRLWRELSAELPKEAEYLPCGSLWVAADEEEFAEVRRKFEFYRGRRIPVEVLDGKQLAEAEPHLRPDMAGALRMPADSVCYPPSVVEYLVKKILSTGGELLVGQEVIGLSDSMVEIADGRRLGAGLVIVANGTAVNALVPEVNVRPRKGHLLITDRYPGFIRHQLIELGYLKSAHSATSDSVAFNAQPRLTGQILIGSSRQFREEQNNVEQHILGRMLKRAIEYMPGLAELSAIRVWVGFRAATPDKLPLIGRYAAMKNVYLATGHEGLGISTALGTARLLRDAILNQPSEISRAPYHPSRDFTQHA